MRLPPLQVYLADLQLLHDLFKKADAQIEYAAPAFTADDPSDLLRFGDETGTSILKQLQITALLKDGGIIEIELGEGGGKRAVQARGNSYEDATTIGLAVQAHDLLKARPRSLPVRVLANKKNVSWMFGALGFVTGMVSSSLSLLQHETPSIMRGVPFTLLVVVGGFALAAAFVLAIFGPYILGSRIHLCNRGDRRPAFEWADYKGWIGTVGGSIVTALAIFALQKWTGWNLQ